ncbi:hypothetical protein AK812_SmicGene32069 [Symbiodinium microadriaticum]|uniref:Uncharacterized protein n=1 Tax=Symbiodinium microadriaticum TaxID=2951 RepID=A0A1Q9CV31_SYMMI|nr:hypothetical protein AK812_SmicGene32069 [Symbiodinium microadriaticum]
MSNHLNLPEWRDPFAAFLEIRTPTNVAWPSVMDPQTAAIRPGSRSSGNSRSGEAGELRFGGQGAGGSFTPRFTMANLELPVSSPRSGISLAPFRRIEAANSDPARPHYGPEVFAWTLRALSDVLKASSGAARPRFGASSGRNQGMNLSNVIVISIRNIRDATKLYITVFKSKSLMIAEMCASV